MWVLQISEWQRWNEIQRHVAWSRHGAQVGIHLRTPPLLFIDMSSPIQIRLGCKIIFRGGSKWYKAGASAETTFVSVPVQGFLFGIVARQNTELRSVRLLIYCWGFAECFSYFHTSSAGMWPGAFGAFHINSNETGARGNDNGQTWQLPPPKRAIIDARNNIAW